jgi:hypothetical protein
LQFWSCSGASILERDHMPNSKIDHQHSKVNAIAAWR